MSVDMAKMTSLCKRRGFIFQSSEIYGGMGSVWDYGPLGVELKRNVKEAWWRTSVYERDDQEGLDAGILMHPKVWEASGHVASFSDTLVDCKRCKKRFRLDKIADARKCPECNCSSSWFDTICANARRCATMISSGNHVFIAKRQAYPTLSSS